MAVRRRVPGAWDGLLVLCASMPYDGIAMADWHLANHLSRLSPVLYVDPPRSPLTRLRRPGAAAAAPGRRLRLAGSGLARLTPVVQPFPSRRGATTLTSVVTRRYLRWAVSRLDATVRAVITAWPQYPVFGSCAEQVGVYWVQDDLVGGAKLLGANARLLDRRERRVAAAADLVAVVTPVLADTWRRRGIDPVLLPNGTDADAYLGVDAAPHPADVSLPGPVAGFIGHINDRTDLSLLEAIADRGRSLLLVGPKSPGFEPARFAALAARPNVCWVGPKPFDQLPSYLRLIDVGLVPYRRTAFNLASFPMKTLEYLAAGRGVVATDLPAIRWLATDLIGIADWPAEFADQVDRAAAQPRTPGTIARRREFAARHTWASRAADLDAAITAAASTAAASTAAAQRAGRRTAFARRGSPRP